MDWIERTKDELRLRGYSQSTDKNYGECLKHYFLFKRGLSEEIEFENIRDFLILKQKEGAAEQTINSYLNAIKFFYREIVGFKGKIYFKTVKKSKKLRKPSDLRINSTGDLIEIDVVVRFIGLMKRYIVTAVDIHSRYSFALCYEKHNSLCARDFIQKLEKVFPYKIKAVQTD